MFPYGDGHFREGYVSAGRQFVQPSCATKPLLSTVLPVAAEDHRGSEEAHGLQAAAHGLRAAAHGLELG